jgi:hypothetical protein
MANPTDLYSYRGDSPTTLPHKIRLSDGRVRTDVSSFTVEELTDAGYTGPIAVPDASETQKIVWNGSALVTLDKTDDELWVDVRRERDRLLKESDWTMLVDATDDLNYREWELFRQRLRDITKNNTSPKNVLWPQSPAGKTADDFDAEPIWEERMLPRVRALEEELESLKVHVGYGISDTPTN